MVYSCKRATGQHFPQTHTDGLHQSEVEHGCRYEAYLTNGFDDNLIANEENRTSFAAAKANADKFEESNSGSPMFTGKFSLRNRQIGEIGISYLTGIYNKWKDDGVILDAKRNASIVAVDFNTALLQNRLNITGEIAKAYIDVPNTYSQAFGTAQLGGFLDLVGTLIQKPILGWERAKINLGIRLEYADYNQGKFKETNSDIADDIWAIVPSIAFRPVGTTVLRFNYRYEQQQDLLGNPPANTGVIQFGLSTYF